MPNYQADARSTQDDLDTDTTALLEQINKGDWSEMRSTIDGMRELLDRLEAISYEAEDNEA